MRREWKPGDVVMLEVGTSAERIGIRCRENDGWRTEAGFMSDETTPSGRTHHPLVVIDPEDRDTARRFAEHAADGDAANWRVESWQRFLREFANPTPPKPDEPQGLGAVVEDLDGERYVRHGLADDPDGEVTWCNSIGVGRSWARINGARILSEGVQP